MAVRKQTYIDPIFWSPEDVTDFIQVEEGKNLNGDDVYVSEGEEFEGSFDTEVWEETAIEEEVTNESPNILPVVDNFSVAEQIVRVKPDGSHVVDVVINVPDYPGVVSYNMRVTRV